MEEWLEEWHEHVRRLRLAHGFAVIGPWVGEDGETFVWVLGHDGDFEGADAAYYESKDRRALEPDPARHVAAQDVRFMRVPRIPAHPAGGADGRAGEARAS